MYSIRIKCTSKDGDVWEREQLYESRFEAEAELETLKDSLVKNKNLILKLGIIETEIHLGQYVNREEYEKFERNLN